MTSLLPRRIFNSPAKLVQCLSTGSFCRSIQTTRTTPRVQTAEQNVGTANGIEQRTASSDFLSPAGFSLLWTSVFYHSVFYYSLSCRLRQMSGSLLQKETYIHLIETRKKTKKHSSQKIHSSRRTRGLIV